MLSEKEFKVFLALAKGQSVAEIAEIMSLSRAPWARISIILTKLGAPIRRNCASSRSAPGARPLTSRNLMKIIGAFQRFSLAAAAPLDHNGTCVLCTVANQTT
jgi:hypothetical protein